MEDKLRSLLGNEVVDELKGLINSIETSIPTTKNHYGRYMSLLSKYDDRDKRVGFAKMMVALGANHEGVVAALRLV